MKATHTAALVAAIAMATTSMGRAAIVISGNFNTGSPAPKLTITQDISFNITTTGDLTVIGLDEWTTNDTTQTSVTVLVGQEISYVNNGTPGTIKLARLFDNYTNSQGILSENDGILFFDQIQVTAGTTFVLKAGSFEFGSSSNFNTLLSDGFTFTGNTALATSSIGRLSENGVSVPEPSAALLSLLGAGFLLRRKR